MADGKHTPPKLTDAEVAFGCIKHLPKREDLPEDFQRNWHRRDHPWCGPVSMLFYEGGSLAQHGLKIKAGLDKADVMRAIRAALCSFDPSHERKIGGIGFLLSQWCDIDAKAKGGAA